MNRQSLVKLMLVTASVALLSGCASLTGNHAEGTNGAGPYKDNLGRHVYAGTGIGAGWVEPDVRELNGRGVNNRVNAAGQLSLGMDISRQMSVEMHTTALGEAGVSPTAGIDYKSHGLSGLMYFGGHRERYRRRGLTGYGRLGVGVLDNSAVGDIQYVQDNSTHLLVGMGMEYMTGMGLGIRAEAISFDEDARYAQVALIFRGNTRRTRGPVQIVKAAPPVVEPVKEHVAPAMAAAISVCDSVDAQIAGGNFYHDSSQLTPDGQEALEQAAIILGECTAVPFRVVAHTDSVGTDEYNQALSERRAAAIVSLFELRGISSTRMSAIGVGESQPIDTNNTVEGRRANRRVELFPQ